MAPDTTLYKGYVLMANFGNSNRESLGANVTAGGVIYETKIGFYKGTTPVAQSTLTLLTTTPSQTDINTYVQGLCTALSATFGGIGITA
jgi:hypothetical protein